MSRQSATVKVTTNARSRNSTRNRRTLRRDTFLSPTGVNNRRGVPSIIPPRFVVSLPYAESLNRGSGIPIDTYQWNLNSIFDPNRTGTGHQPLGSDQWAAFYNRYRVLMVRCRLDVVNESSSVPFRITLAGVNGSSLLTGLNSVEQPYSRTALVGSSQGTSVRTIDFMIDLARLNGKTRMQYNDSDVTNAVFGSSPSELMVLNTYATSLTGGNIAYSLVLRLDYIVELSDPVELTES